MVEFVEKFDSSSAFILDRDAPSPTFVVNMSKVKKEFLDEFVESLNEIKRLERKKYEKFQRKKSIRLSKKKAAPKIPASDKIKSVTKSNIITDENGYVFITEDTVFDGNSMINNSNLLNQNEKDFLNSNGDNKILKSPVPDESYFSDSSYKSDESGAFIKKAAQIIKQEHQSSGHSSDNENDSLTKQEHQSSGHSSDNEHDSLTGNPVNFAYEKYPKKLNNKYSRFTDDDDDDGVKTEDSENTPVKKMPSAESVAYTKASGDQDNFAYDQYPKKLNNKYSRFMDDDDEKTPIKKLTKYQRKCKTEVKKKKKFEKPGMNVEGETLENHKTSKNQLSTLDKSKKIFESLVNLAKRTTGYRKSMRSYHLKDYNKYNCLEKDVANLTL